MKILMTTDCIGGVWTYCMELCAALASSGVQIVLASMGASLSDEQQRQVSQLPHVELHAQPFRLCWMEEPWHDVEQAGHWLLDLEQQHQPDIVHLNDLGHGHLPWQAPVLLVGHSCVLSWWQAVRKAPAPAQWNRYRERVSAGVQRADLVAAPTHTMLTALQQYYGPTRAATTIHNGREFPPLIASADAKERVAQPLVFTAGRLWDDAKNMAALREIAHDLDWPIHAAGQDVPRVQASPFPTLGHLTPEQLARWLAAASIYVAPARYEPFGLAILEAARARCALVLGDIPSLHDVWGDAALYVDPDRPDEIRIAINALIAEPARLQMMGELANRRARHYTATRMATQYQRCYRFLLHNDRRQQQRAHG